MDTIITFLQNHLLLIISGISIVLVGSIIALVNYFDQIVKDDE